jgi:5-methylcytosine-specific restriction protein A
MRPGGRVTVHPTLGNLVRQSWPKKQPKRRKTVSAFPDSVRDIILTRSGGVCEIDGCGPATAVHHRAPRGMGGSRGGWVNRAANGIAVSDACHAAIESDRETALKNGWLLSRNGRQMADEVEVLLFDFDPDRPKGDRRRKVLLTDEGDAVPTGEGI